VNEHDQYIQSQIGPILQPGEQVLFVALMRRQPGIIWQILFALISALLMKPYFAVLTNRRLLLIRTKLRAFTFTGVPKHLNLGVEEHDVRQLQSCSTGGIANNRSMTFQLASGSKMTLRISPMFKIVTGTKEFFDRVPDLINSGQLAQLASGGQGYAAMPAQGAWPQLPMQQPMAPAPPMGGFGPGARVLVVARDGGRYPATVVQAQGGHYLCAMPDGQQHWIEAQSVGPA